jgi:hypothetical protein
MRSIEFRLVPGGTPERPLIQIVIDGRDLIERVSAVELPQATADGQPELAGSYSWLAVDDWVDHPEFNDDGCIAVLGCECGVVACWPLLVRITRRGGTVTWSDFRQPHRDWTYDRLDPFTFRESDYDRAATAIVHDRDNR